MCIIIVQTKEDKKRLPFETVRQAFSSNPDGAGFAYFDHETGKVRARKPYYTFRRYWERYKEFFAHTRGKSDLILHMRISTGGKIDQINTHPHTVHSGLALAHNGVLTIQPTDKHSDTVRFVREYLPDLPPDWYTRPVYLKLVDSFIRPSKFALIDTTGKATIIGEKRHECHWNEEKTRWFSNSSYKKDRWTCSVYSSKTVRDYSNGWTSGNTIIGRIHLAGKYANVYFDGTVGHCLNDSPQYKDRTKVPVITPIIAATKRDRERLNEKAEEIAKAFKTKFSRLFTHGETEEDLAEKKPEGATICESTSDTSETDGENEPLEIDIPRCRNCFGPIDDASDSFKFCSDCLPLVTRTFAGDLLPFD